ncbi:MAG: PQQ-dependent sugar dehydrogenase [Acidimicrobiia bacterium]|nr:PQQ-dependent sugar dehydrogenase [Acidimicrobiia bacterium]
MKVPFLFMLGVACLTIVTGCVGDDASDVADGVITAQPTVAGRGATTTNTNSDPGSDNDTEEPAPSTPPEELPDPEWAGAEFVLQPIAGTDRGLAMAVRDDDDIWLVERDGRVRLIEGPVTPAEDTGDSTGTVVLDISDKVGTDGEGGLLGLDFSPAGDHLYLSYTDTSGNSVIAEYEMDSTAPLEGTDRILLQVEQPFSNHNGGQITVGPDGFLYVALGDGGSGGDPLGSGQDTSTLLGSILRIDPAGGTAGVPYAIPADNPFVGQDGARDEIWLYGVRNPWRFSFDADTGDLWIGDVGQGEIEEIDFLAASSGEPAGRGANLGWNILEGEQPFSGEAPPPDLIGPIAWYGHDNGRCSVTGGYVYRGDRIPALAGVYIFGDYCTGEVFGIRRFDDGRTTQAPLAIEGDVGQIVSFGQGPDGELYVFESNGTLSRLQTTETATDR